MATNERVVVVLLVAVAVAVAFVGPVAADHDVPKNGTEGEAYGQIQTGENSTLVVHQAAGAMGDGGWMVIECEGNTTLTHECDKRGELDAGPVSVDYEGYNDANPPGLSGGGGDDVTVSMGNQSATGEFDCDLQTSTLPQPCTVNGSSSETGGASLP
ncbi:hypothetical protein [Halorarius litoreus]|uniref:hypothetical protein n=1 Tax=Halorarius litoreus TaxID=2962676 RepID=UPI0020CE357F|nr:hypothetical protein [Halorarius litoreus]